MNWLTAALFVDASPLPIGCEKKNRYLIKKIDKQRRYYYNYFTDKKWEDMTQYDICLDSGSIPEEQILDVLAALYESIL